MGKNGNTMQAPNPSRQNLHMNLVINQEYQYPH